jgi:hypothetical protein
VDRGLTQLSAAERLTLVFDLRAEFQTVTPGEEVSALLKKLATDQEPEIVKAAADPIKK